MDPITLVCTQAQQVILSGLCFIATPTVPPVVPTPPPTATQVAAQPTAPPVPQPTVFPPGSVVDFCDTPEIVEEGSSTSAVWRVTSGGRWLRGIEGTCQSIHGDLPAGDKWRTRYASANPRDTDSGLHPQNIGRFPTRAKFRAATHSVRFRIDKTNLSTSENRNASNGVLFFLRYQDEDHLYYAGIRVDGALVVKRKNGPVATGYTTLGSRKVLPGTYNRTSNPQLIPQWTWHTLTVEIADTPEGHVAIAVKLDDYVALSVTDRTPPATHKVAGASGLRIDFADVSFDDFKVVPK